MTFRIKAASVRPARRTGRPRSSHVVALAAAVVLVLAGSAQAADSTRPELGDFGIDLSARNANIRPQDDFFRYANGAWLDEYEIPEDLAGYGSFTHLFLRSEEHVKTIIEEAAAASDSPKGSLTQKIGDLYRDFLNDGARESKALKPLEDALGRIRSAATHEDLARVMAEGVREGVGTPFGFYIDQDARDPSVYIPHLVQSGLALPDRDYYLVNDNPRFQKARDAYRTYLEKIFTATGDRDPAGAAAAVLAMETRLAEAHWKKEDTRDLDKTYNKMTAAELAGQAPGFPWESYFEALGFAGQKTYIVMSPSAYTGMAAVFADTPPATWKSWLVARVVQNNAALLPEAIDDAQFEFVSTAITGSKEKRARWKRGVQFINQNLGEAVGRMYVERHFSSEAKTRVDELVNNLLVAMGERIDGLDWMSPATKVEARAKLAKFTVKIGYPEQWRDYFALDIRPGDLVGNANRARAFQHDYDVSKLSKPVNRLEWFMPPQTVNAYYNPGMNEIVFPAAILQPPFFDAHADDAVNYGGIGAVIGHEIGHGFDDQGRKSDGDGVMREWWTEEDAARFKERADLLVSQYGKFSPLEGMHVNGQLTLGENIGDVGGLEIAYHAYRLSLKGAEPPVIGGLTGDQRFFLSYAQIWKGKMRDEILATQISGDPHSPVEFRVNGALRNIAAFYAAFGVKSGDAMYLPETERARIW